MDYLWETGIAPLSAGSCFFMLGAADLLQRFLPQTNLAQQGIKWLAICLGFAVMWGTRSIKDRLVFSRGGYVDHKSDEWFASVARWILLLVLPMVLLPLAFIYVFAPDGHLPDLFFDSRLIVPGFAVLFAAQTLYHGRMRKAPLLYGIYLLCLALLIWGLPLSPTERFGLLQAGAGGPLAVFGAMRLRAFLKANPKPMDLTIDG